MEYRTYKGEEYYGRDIHYIGTHVLYCSDHGYLGTYDTLEQLEVAKEYHEKERHDIKLYMIGTHTCSFCKSLYPIVEKECVEHNIGFQYFNIDDNSIPRKFIDILVNSHIMKSPVFLLYRGLDNEPSIIQEDNIISEIHNIKV